MLRRIIVAGALAASALIVPAAVAASADAATSSAAASCYKRVGNHWTCITPGAYCPAAAHGKYGYAKVTGISGGSPVLQGREESGPRQGWPGGAGTAQSV